MYYDICGPEALIISSVADDMTAGKYDDMCKMVVVRRLYDSVQVLLLCFWLLVFSIVFIMENNNLVTYLTQNMYINLLNNIILMPLEFGKGRRGQFVLFVWS